MRGNVTIRGVTWSHIHDAGDGSKVLRDDSLWKTRWLYHFLIWPHAREIFANRQLRLSPVGTWSDPYENWWCRQLFTGPNRLRGVNAYGLCWTKRNFDEPFWRMTGFGKNEPIVRIRCRPDDILNAGVDLISHTSASVFLGSAKYQRESALRELAQVGVRADSDDVSYTASSLLLQKRNAFRFENEVRLLWLDRGVAQTEQFLPIDPRIVTQVMTTPHASKEQHEKIVNELSAFGVNPVQSAVLRIPE